MGKQVLRRLINDLVDAIQMPPAETDGDSNEEALRTAAAVLMLDVARADHVFDESEFARVLDLVEKHFGLAPEAAVQLVNEADVEAENLTSLHNFTQLLHNNLDDDETAKIIGLLWQIAYADGRLDMYEDSLILKISDLLHVSRGRVMRLKHDAAGASN